MKKKDITYTLVDTEVRFSYNDYLDFCAANGLEPHEEGSDDYWDVANEMITLSYLNCMDNIKFSKENDGPVLVTGTLGLWNGTKTIYPTKCDCLFDAVEKCIGSSDGAKVTFSNGVVIVEAYHHDGTNRFTINKLSKKGLTSTNKYDEYFPYNVEIKKEWVKKFKMI